MAPTTQAGRVVRITTNGDNGDDPLHELFAVDDDRGALDAFNEQFKVYDGAHVVGPLLATTVALLTLTDGQATPL